MHSIETSCLFRLHLKVFPIFNRYECYHVWFLLCVLGLYFKTYDGSYILIIFLYSYIRFLLRCAAPIRPSAGNAPFRGRNENQSNSISPPNVGEFKKHHVSNLSFVRHNSDVLYFRSRKSVKSYPIHEV